MQSLSVQYMKLPERHERESLEDRLPTLAPEAIKFLQVFLFNVLPCHF